MLSTTKAIDTQHLRPRLPVGFKMLQTNHKGYYVESLNGDFATEDFSTPEAACRAVRRYRREQKCKVKPLICSAVVGRIDTVNDGR